MVHQDHSVVHVGREEPVDPVGVAGTTHQEAVVVSSG